MGASNLGAQHANKRLNQRLPASTAPVTRAIQRPSARYSFKPGQLQKDIFCEVPTNWRSLTGLVQQTVQIVASHDLTLFVIGVTGPVPQIAPKSLKQIHFK